MILRVLLVLGALMLAACAGDSVVSPATSAPVDTTTVAETTTTTEAPGAELVGRWAHFDVVAYEDGDFKTMIVSYGFNNFMANEGQIIDDVEFCFSEQVSNQPFEAALSDEGTKAIKPPATPLEVERVDEGLRIFRPATPTPVGIRLDDPANEPLPDDPDDPRIVDDDGDGNPGVTVNIEVAGLVGELYIARREIFAYDALLSFDEPDTVLGEVTDSSEQLVIGADNPLFLGGDTDFVQHPNLEKSPIILKRVEQDWDCARLRSERDAIFPPTPVVDW